MKIKTIFALLAMLAALPMGAKETAETANFDYIEQNGQKFIHVSTVTSVEANTQFMQNMQLVNQQRQALIELNKRKEIAFTQAEKDAIDAKMKEIEEGLTKNSKTMMEAYGYSLSRDSIPVFVKTHLYRKLTEEEYGKIKDKPEYAGKIRVKADDKFLLIHTINTAKDNAIFQSNLNAIQQQNARYLQVQAALKSMPASEEKDKLNENNEKLGEALAKNKEEMAKLYGGFSLNQSYLLEVEESKLYVKVTEEEFLKARESSKEAELKKEAQDILKDNK